MRYDVVVVGFRLNASLKPAQALQSVLGLDLETSKELTRRFPSAVLSGVSLSRAERVSQELTDAGAKVEVRESRLSLANVDACGPAREHAAEAHEHAAEAHEQHQAAGHAGSSHSDRAAPESGNYEIGEILAPLGKLGNPQPAPAAQAQTPAAKRPSREELDQALRESFRPDPENADSALQTEAAPQRDKLELMDNSAFAGLQNFGDDFDDFQQAPAKLQVEEVALRSIQRRPEPADARTGPARSRPARVGRWLSHAGAAVLEWGGALLGLLLVVAITLLAVGYALDPADMLGAVGLRPLSAGMRQLLSALFGN